MLNNIAHNVNNLSDFYILLHNSNYLFTVFFQLVADIVLKIGHSCLKMVFSFKVPRGFLPKYFRDNLGKYLKILLYFYVGFTLTFFRIPHPDIFCGPYLAIL